MNGAGLGMDPVKDDVVVVTSTVGVIMTLSCIVIKLLLECGSLMLKIGSRTAIECLRCPVAVYLYSPRVRGQIIQPLLFIELCHHSALLITLSV